MQHTNVARRFGQIMPVVGLVLLFFAWGSVPSPAFTVVLLVVHVALVMVSVAHAEDIAHRVGEPFGTLVLAIAVTAIEVSLVLTLMFSEGDKAATLARDTVFAAIMIVCNAVIGLSLLANARKHRTVKFSEQGANALLGTIATLATLSLVLPTFTTSSPAGTYTAGQFAFAAVAAFVVYAIFVFVQTVGHRWMFLSPDALEFEANNEFSHVVARSDGEHGRSIVSSVVMLAMGLVGVVGLAKSLAPRIEDVVVWAGAPQSFVGVVIAVMILLPESVAAVRAASRGEMQTSINLSLGSALASIGLTIPAIALASIWIDGPIVLGLGSKEIALLALTFIVSALTFGSGKATVLQASHHLAIFTGFVFLSIFP